MARKRTRLIIENCLSNERRGIIFLADRMLFSRLFFLPGYLETVAESGLRQNITWVGWILFQLLAQSANINPQVACLVAVFRPPNLREEVRVRDKLARLLG